MVTHCFFERDGLPWNPSTFGPLRASRDAKLPESAPARSAPFVRVTSAAGGADLKTVSTALGHSTIAATADTCAHVSPTMLHEAANLLDRVVESGRNVEGLQRA
jgi:hypothetical protein